MLFSLGRTVATPGALTALEEAGEEPLKYLQQHVSGNWGDLDKEDQRSNDLAVLNDARVFSAYLLSNGEKIWVITEADRSSTCILRPDEY